MTTTFNLPDLGEGLPDAEIVSWHVAEGDTVKTDDAEAIRRSMENLQTTSQALGKIMYEEAAKQQPAPADASANTDEPTEDNKKDDDVIDAEFEVKE